MRRLIAYIFCFAIGWFCRSVGAPIWMPLAGFLIAVVIISLLEED